MILNPLQRVQVLESTKKCKAGSIGYFVAQDPINSYNGWDMCIIFTRFGKKGKLRVEPVTIRPRMIDYSTMKESDQYILEIAGTYEGIEPRRYPDRRGRLIGKLGDTKLEPVPSDTKDLLNVSIEEFTAYIVAMSMLMYKLQCGRRVSGLNKNPSIKSRRFARSGFDLSTVSPSVLGHYILFGISYDSKGYKQSMFEEKGITFAEALAAQTDTLGKKRDLLNRLRKLTAMYKTTLANYQVNLERAFQNNSARINEVIKHYRRSKKEVKNLKEQNDKNQGYGWHVYAKTSKRGR